MFRFASTLDIAFCLLSASILILLALACHLRVRLAQSREEAGSLRKRLDAMHHNVNETLGSLREELARLDELADRLGALTGHCDKALQQQQARLERVTSTVGEFKADGQQLAEDALLVGSESRQSLRLALEGQAGLSATLMVFRTMDKPGETKEVRVLARQGRDQTYNANLAMAGISAAASTLDERGTQIARTCEAQLRRIEDLDENLTGIRQLAYTTAWRNRQVQAASQELLCEAARLKASCQISTIQTQVS